ncbi:MAG: hypothetical protein ACFFCS_22415 [Candidatus Hodarchaeota archaeon]
MQNAINFNEQGCLESVSINFFCKECNKKHKLEVDPAIFNTERYPISYIYVHGDPQIVATLYIDAKQKVRGVEFSSGIGVKTEQLHDILERSKIHALKSIPGDQIYAFQLFEEKKLIKYYVKPGYEEIIDFSGFKVFRMGASKLVKWKDEWSEFFIRYDDFWISGVFMMGYYFIIIVNSTIDVDRLKTQMMAILETLMS